MNYLAQIKRLSDDVEEEVVLRINGLEVTCFATVCPYKIEEGASYQVELTAQVFNEYLVSELDEDASASIVQIGGSFSHVITGRLSGNRLEAGAIVFEDDVLLSDFGYLEGKMIAWKIDRIDAEFLSDDFRK
ncbi:hypothetical protein RY831_31075 [Noviherbaspirillum sp. CPCC 100848]|uniref:Uncharacterized protein n=1 Tax=Noviherbaspirillum album TaxID=3080276 RepID=A0ABU6JJ87_9BURK|nr:hypothetical protein [Noviherbaspirillum sp. CPCC 100848]MEC4723583.1 hypothetical protein [Noviherbaspirillum sp. CPCC 100848]